ncbi:lipoprotein insertase outer membrane protein LolB [Methylomonas sp. MgM2]
MMKHIVVFALPIFLLGACSVTPERMAENYHLADMLYLQQQRQWGLRGRLAVVSEKDSVSVSLVWRHLEDDDDIELVGPLGQGRVKINVTPGRIVVDDGDSREVFYGHADAVLSEQLGIEMPVKALRFWVLGVNDPAQDYVEQAGGFYQGGWLVRYREMQKVGSDILPKKMTVEKEKTRIKLMVDQWDLS